LLESDDARHFMRQSQPRYAPALLRAGCDFSANSILAANHDRDLFNRFVLPTRHFVRQFLRTPFAPFDIQQDCHAIRGNRFQDPARFSLAHGGKDRHPYPVPIKVYDETIRVLKSAVQNAKLGRDEEMGALKRLDDQARRLERTAQGPTLESFIATERAASPALDGRSVFGWERDVDSSDVIKVRR